MVIRTRYGYTEKIFQQDNAWCHASHQVRESFEEEEESVAMKWPALSHDLNHINHL